MSTTTIRRIPTFLVLAVIGVAAMVIWPSMRSIVDGRDEQVAVITISFSPVQRSGYAPPGRTMIDHVMFQITMGDAFFPKEFATQSPQVRTVIPKVVGRTNISKISVIAEQLYGTRLSCSIVYPGVPPSRHSNPGPSSVACSISVKVA